MRDLGFTLMLKIHPYNSTCPAFWNPHSHQKKERVVERELRAIYIYGILTRIPNMRVLSNLGNFGCLAAKFQGDNGEGHSGAIIPRQTVLGSPFTTPLTL